ncbi:MAG TPA: hypothetical protein VIE35_05130, partial [Dongiaceae bacterium]
REQAGHEIQHVLVRDRRVERLVELLLLLVGEPLALLREHLADRLAIFRAPSLIGGDGLPAAEGFGLDRLAELPLFQPQETVWLGADRLETYRRAH